LEVNGKAIVVWTVKGKGSVEEKRDRREPVNEGAVICLFCLCNNVVSDLASRFSDLETYTECLELAQS
jgi:H2-forming N5,N10-methylenetetrahydromethanopterin dehydrogenase-like enzyme